MTLVTAWMLWRRNVDLLALIWIEYSVALKGEKIHNVWESDKATGLILRISGILSTCTILAPLHQFLQWRSKRVLRTPDIIRMIGPSSGTNLPPGKLEFSIISSDYSLPLSISHLWHDINQKNQLSPCSWTYQFHCNVSSWKWPQELSNTLSLHNQSSCLPLSGGLNQSQQSEMSKVVEFM
jgi:hypothetical protein